MLRYLNTDGTIATVTASNPPSTTATTTATATTQKGASLICPTLPYPALPDLVTPRPTLSPSQTAKNLILSNVGGVVVWDPEVACMRDMGSNFYLNEQHVAEGTTRSEACLAQLKSLNPHCKVEAYNGELGDEYLLQKDVNGTGKPFATVIVTQLLPKADLFRINQVG